MRSTILALALVLPLPAQSPMFRGDAIHAGVSTAPSQPLKGQIAWSFEAMRWELYQSLENMDGGNVWPTTPAVVDSRIYLCAGPFFYALDQAGKQIYRKQLGGRSLASPAVVGGIAYLPTEEGLLYALNAQDGRILWTCAIGGSSWLKQLDNWDVYHSSPAVSGGLVYVGSGDGRIYAIDAISGKQKWHFQTGHVVRATPAVAQGRVFCGSFDGKVYALDAASGRKLWELNTTTKGMPWHSVQGSCAVVDDVVYVGSRSGFLYAIEAATGQLRWQESHEGSWVPSSPAVRDGQAYVGQSDGNQIVSVDAKGKRLWVHKTPSETFASPTLAGEVLYVGCNDNYNLKGKGSLCALDIKTGKALWTLELPSSVWSSPVVAGDTVYVCDANGKLFAVR